jgi:hypothetical protein
MNEELKNKLNTMSVDLIDQIQKGAEWTGEQTSLFVKEYIAVYIIQHAIYFVFWLAASIVLGFASRKLWKMSNDDENYSSARELFTILSIVSFLGCIASFTSNIHTNAIELAKGIWAPRVVIVEQLRLLIK